MEKTEFEFPDEIEAKKGGKVEAKQEEDDFSFEVEEDTPPEDRGREPLPKEIVQELEQDELEDYSEKLKTRLKQMKKVYHDERREKAHHRDPEQRAALLVGTDLVQSALQAAGHLQFVEAEH